RRQQECDREHREHTTCWAAGRTGGAPRPPLPRVGWIVLRGCGVHRRPLASSQAGGDNLPEGVLGTLAIGSHSGHLVLLLSMGKYADVGWMLTSTYVLASPLAPTLEAVSGPDTRHRLAGRLVATGALVPATALGRSRRLSW